MNNIFADVATDLGRTVAEAKPLLMKLNNADTSKRPSAAKWSKKEILGHLLDSASNHHQHFLRATVQGSLTFPGYEQDKLVDLQQFKEMDWGFLVDFWAGYNRFLAHVLTCLPARAVNTTCVIGNHEPATLGSIAQGYADHLKHHLNQIVGKKFETRYGAKA